MRFKPKKKEKTIEKQNDGNKNKKKRRRKKKKSTSLQRLLWWHMCTTQKTPFELEDFPTELYNVCVCVFMCRGNMRPKFAIRFNISLLVFAIPAIFSIPVLPSRAPFVRPHHASLSWACLHHEYVQGNIRILLLTRFVRIFSKVFLYHTYTHRLLYRAGYLLPFESIEQMQQMILQKFLFLFWPMKIPTQMNFNEWAHSFLGCMGSPFFQHKTFKGEMEETKKKLFSVENKTVFIENVCVVKGCTIFGRCHTHSFNLIIQLTNVFYVSFHLMLVHTIALASFALCLSLAVHLRRLLIHVRYNHFVSAFQSFKMKHMCPKIFENYERFNTMMVFF